MMANARYLPAMETNMQNTFKPAGQAVADLVAGIKEPEENELRDNLGVVTASQAVGVLLAQVGLGELTRLLADAAFDMLEDMRGRPNVGQSDEYFLAHRARDLANLGETIQRQIHVGLWR